MRLVDCKQLGATHTTLDMSEPEPPAASVMTPARTLVRRTACTEMLNRLAALSFCHGVTILETPRADAWADLGPNSGAMGTARLLHLQKQNLWVANAESTEVAIYQIQQALLVYHPRMEKLHSKRHELTFCLQDALITVLVLHARQETLLLQMNESTISTW